MCGIFGVAVKKDNRYTKKDIQEFLEVLFKLSESRGKEAAGLAVRKTGSLNVLKLPIPADDFLRSSEYKKFSEEAFGGLTGSGGQDFLAVIGHARLATHGNEYFSHNNQPVIKEKAVCVHNGIIVNEKQLWEKFPGLKKEYEVDTEIVVSLIQLFLSETGSTISAAQKMLATIEGSASVAALFGNNYQLTLTTNTGSLYGCYNLGGDVFVFASEKYILEQFADKVAKISVFSKEAIKQIAPGTAMSLDVRNFEPESSVRQPDNFRGETRIIDYPVGLKAVSRQIYPVIGDGKIRPELRREMENVWAGIYSGNGLKRCVKCLLPETMTFIDFDEQGVCNYCRDYKKIEVKGSLALEKEVEKYRSHDGKPDCILTFSGGRDSSYGLHYFKKVLKMNPIAFTYDWGMMTDLGRRNEARLCGKLGVEHIIISADVRKKRHYIHKNLEAWLKRPELGTIPLLMAGDKDLLYYTNWLRKKTNIKLMVDFYAGQFEEDLFKVGFAKVRTKSIHPGAQSLSFADRMKLSAYYASRYILNPSYINRSFFDTAFAYLNAIFYPWDILRLFEYVKWDEKEVVSTIINEYGWEVEPDTNATWRIDDGTASFYNYVYMAVAGFTEFETLRSVQIREGQMSREEAYRMIKEENKPRFEAIEWYCKTVGVDPNKAIERINLIPKLYKLR
jgi:asparagine synthetase B (glutamine-hydrolysing)